MDTETYKLKAGSNRQNMIEHLPIGETISQVRRIDITFGVSNKELRKHSELISGGLHCQVNRTRRKFPGRVYTVETATMLNSSSTAILIVAAATRIS